jgi:hypothetical protein
MNGVFKSDVIGKSHEGMHWCVVIGIVLFYHLAKFAFLHRKVLSLGGENGKCVASW